MKTDPRSPERGQYEFVQALVRTIAYETIGRRERKRRHKAAAEYLEALGGEELSEVIAAHYVDAHRLAPATPTPSSCGTTRSVGCCEPSSARGRLQRQGRPSD